jgi:branched-chain amino acid transport system substrate-binding protein
MESVSQILLVVNFFKEKYVMKKQFEINKIALAVAMSLGTSLVSAQSGPIKIGVVTPLSGTYTPIGEQVKMGLDLAAKEINAAGGINGRKINLIYEDEEANPAVATQKAEKLFQVEKVDFLTGTVNSGSTLAVGQVAERNNKLIATSVSFADSITGDKCSPNVFRVNARAGMQSAALAAWVDKEIPKANIFFIGPDYEMGRSTVSAFKRASTEKGAKDVGEVFAPLDNKDYSPYFGQVRAAKPNVIYTSVAGNDTVRLFSQMEEYGLNKGVTLVGASGTVTSQNMGAIGKSANGFVTGVGYSPKLDNPANKKFVADFQKAYNKLPDLYGADSYGLLYFYKAAVEKAKSTETDKVRTAMDDLSWQTPQGTKKMRAGDHQAMQDMFAVRVENGEFNIVGRVPSDQAIGPDVCTRF